MARSYIAVAVERAVRQRARHQCEYCRALDDFNTDPFNIEHIAPVSRGGTDGEENLALSCFGCNLSKGVRVDAVDPITGGRVALFNPRRERWSEHFQWSEDFVSVEARTATGRVTIVALDLNRRKLQNLRRALIRYEVHPPADE